MRPNQKKGQSSLEFLYSIALSLLFFAIIIIIFSQGQQDANSLSSALLAKKTCTSVSAQIGKIASSGDGTVAQLYIPLDVQYRDYSIYVSGANRSVSVRYGESGIGCLFAGGNVSNGTSNSFQIQNNAIIRNVNGGVLIE